MWLPTPLYEKAPHYWLFLGLFLLVVGIYLGLEMHRGYLYLGLGLGLACLAWSARTYWQRSFNRENAAREPDTETAEQV